MSKAEYIVQEQYASGTVRPTPGSGVTPRTRFGCAARVDQILGAPVVRLAAPAQVPFRIGFECMRPENLPLGRGIENITTSENGMHDELSAVRQGIDAALS